MSGSLMGSSGKFARFMVVTPENRREQMIIFRNLDKFEEFLTQKYGKDSVERLFAGKGDYLVSVVYQLGWNTYRGVTEKQLIIQNFC